MYALLRRDGSRTEIEAADLWEAMRASVRLNAVQLEVPGDPPRLMSAEQVRQELALDRPGLFAAYTPGWQAPSVAAGLSASKAGLLVGVEQRKIRKWAGGEGEAPYAVWRLLSIYAGLADAPRYANNEITK
jgi:hypothetical protein